jgi:hypothetical protein
MAIDLPLEFGPELFVLSLLNRFEAHGPSVAFDWACQHKEDFAALDREAVRRILHSSHGAEKELISIMLDEIWRLRQHACADKGASGAIKTVSKVNVLNKGCGTKDWVEELKKQGNERGVDMTGVNTL